MWRQSGRGPIVQLLRKLTHKRHLANGLYACSQVATQRVDAGRGSPQTITTSNFRAHFIGRGGALLGGLRKCVACSKPCAI
jgi:hypothetical protein